MSAPTTDRTLTEVLIENLGDWFAVERGLIDEDQVRRLVVPDAVVCLETLSLALPTVLLRQLGLKKQCDRRATSAREAELVSVYDPVRLTILGRDCSVDVMEAPDDAPVRVGRIPLLMLDLVIDPHARRLIGNPAHGGKHTLELY